MRMSRRIMLAGSRQVNAAPHITLVNEDGTVREENNIPGGVLYIDGLTISWEGVHLCFYMNGIFLEEIDAPSKTPVYFTISQVMYLKSPSMGILFLFPDTTSKYALMVNGRYINIIRNGTILGLNIPEEDFVDVYFSLT